MSRPRNPDTPRAEFAAEFNLWMARHQISLKQAATVLGRPYATVSNWSQGRREPSRQGAYPTQYDLVRRAMDRYRLL